MSMVSSKLTFAIRHSQSAIRNPQSAIPNQLPPRLRCSLGRHPTHSLNVFENTNGF
jgi:hypothetical protein